MATQDDVSIKIVWLCYTVVYINQISNSSWFLFWGQAAGLGEAEVCRRLLDLRVEGSVEGIGTGAAAQFPRATIAAETASGSIRRIVSLLLAAALLILEDGGGLEVDLRGCFFG